MAMAADNTSAAIEIIAGARESAVRLLSLLRATGADPGRQNLAEQIIRCIDSALAAVRGAGNDKKRRSAHGPTARPPAGSKPRVMGRGETGAKTVVTSATDDGFAWRKYGEKIINRHMYPRFYFRCTYRDEHGCSAKKQVQQTDDDPSLFYVTYFGEHMPSCPRDATVAVVDSSSVPQPPFVLNFRPIAASGRPCSDDKAPQQVPSLPTEGEELPTNVPEFEEYWPVEDLLMKLASPEPDVSFASLAGSLEYSDSSLEEIISLLWS